MENEKLAVLFVFTSTLNHCAGARCQAVIKKITTNIITAFSSDDWKEHLGARGN